MDDIADVLERAAEFGKPRGADAVWTAASSIAVTGGWREEEAAADDGLGDLDLHTVSGPPGAHRWGRALAIAAVMAAFVGVAVVAARQPGRSEGRNGSRGGDTTVVSPQPQSTTAVARPLPTSQTDARPTTASSTVATRSPTNPYVIEPGREVPADEALTVRFRWGDGESSLGLSPPPGQGEGVGPSGLSVGPDGVAYIYDGVNRRVAAIDVNGKVRYIPVDIPAGRVSGTTFVDTEGRLLLFTSDALRVIDIGTGRVVATLAAGDVFGQSYPTRLEARGDVLYSFTAVWRPLLRVSKLTPVVDDPANDPPSALQYRTAGDDVEVETGDGVVTVSAATGIGGVIAYERHPVDGSTAIAVQARATVEGTSPPIELIRFGGSEPNSSREITGDAYGMPDGPLGAFRDGTLYLLTANADGPTLRVFPRVRVPDPTVPSEGRSILLTPAVAPDWPNRTDAVPTDGTAPPDGTYWMQSVQIEPERVTGTIRQVVHSQGCADQQAPAVVCNNDYAILPPRSPATLDLAPDVVATIVDYAAPSNHFSLSIDDLATLLAQPDLATALVPSIAFTANAPWLATVADGRVTALHQMFVP